MIRSVKQIIGNNTFNLCKNISLPSKSTNCKRKHNLLNLNNILKLENILFMLYRISTKPVIKRGTNLRSFLKMKRLKIDKIVHCFRVIGTIISYAVIVIQLNLTPACVAVATNETSN